VDERRAPHRLAALSGVREVILFPWRNARHNATVNYGSFCRITDGVERRRYGQVFIRRLRSMGIRDRPTSPRSPWQNGYAERLIGSIRRECLDLVVVFGERHLRHVLLSYMNYYNEARTHLSLDKDAPVTRAVATTGRMLGHPILGGLHHQYVRI